jgi:dTMP kinase
MKPLFIVFEGIDGSGKDSQADLLARYFVTKGEPSHISPEPSNGEIGQIIRKYLSGSSIPMESPRAKEDYMARLFSTDRHHHLYNTVDGVYIKKERDRAHVISPRYYFSSLAYQGVTLSQWDFVQSLNERFPTPDITIYLDVLPEVGLSRVRDRGKTEYYEKLDKLTQARERYLKMFRDYQSTLIFLNGQGTIEEVHAQIVTQLKLLRQE